MTDAPVRGAVGVEVRDAAGQLPHQGAADRLQALGDIASIAWVLVMVV